MDIVLPLLGGLLLLALGGELFVRGAVSIAERLGVSPLLIGLTLVGFGTSTPELVTSVQASLSDSPGIAVGNIVGSNIANTLLILGLCALLVPIAVGQGALLRDGVIALAVGCALAGVAVFGTLDRAVGVTFLIGLSAYVAYAWREERVAAGSDHTAAYDKALAFEETHPKRDARAPTPGWRGWVMPGVLALAGLALVMLGGRLLVDAAIDLARGLGVGEAVIGLTIVAVGTSLPELVTSLVAAFRRHADVALGNVLGSNIYNILGIGGATAILAPTPVPPEIAGFDVWVMLAASAALILFGRTGWRIGRREGAAFLAAYVFYVWAIWP
jgi:cation:H+ antiporter